VGGGRESIEKSIPGAMMERQEGASEGERKRHHVS